MVLWSVHEYMSVHSTSWGQCGRVSTILWDWCWGVLEGSHEAASNVVLFFGWRLEGRASDARVLRPPFPSLPVFLFFFLFPPAHSSSVLASRFFLRGGCADAPFAWGAAVSHVVGLRWHCSSPPPPTPCWGAVSAPGAVWLGLVPEMVAGMRPYAWLPCSPAWAIFLRSIPVQYVARFFHNVFEGHYGCMRDSLETVWGSLRRYFLGTSKEQLRKQQICNEPCAHIEIVVTWMVA